MTRLAAPQRCPCGHTLRPSQESVPPPLPLRAATFARVHLRRLQCVRTRSSIRLCFVYSVENSGRGQRKGRAGESSKQVQERAKSPGSKAQPSTLSGLKELDDFLEGQRFSRKQKERVLKRLEPERFKDIDSIKDTYEMLKKSLTLSQDDINSLLLRNVNVLFLPRDRVERTLNLMAKALDVRKDVLKKIVVRQPSCLNLLPESISAKLEFLSASGVPPEKIGSVIAVAPALLTLSITENLTPKVDYLKDALNLEANSEQLGRVLGKQPTVLCCSMDSLMSRVDFFLGNGFNNEEMRTIVLRCPSVLNSSISRMQQKLDYGRNVIGCSLKDIVSHPPFLMYSLYERIHPRYTYVDTMKGKPKVSLSSMLAPSDSSWCQRQGFSLVEYQDFREDLLNQQRLQLMSQVAVGMNSVGQRMSKLLNQMKADRDD